MTDKEDKLERKILMLESALRFYAKGGHVRETGSGGHGGGSVTVLDFGERAKLALKTSSRLYDTE